MSDSNDNTPDNESEGMKNLRAAAARAEEAEARAQAAERRAAFLEAGVPLSSKPAQALMASYSGEMTPEAIKAEAAEWGLLPSGDTPPPNQGDPTPTNDGLAQERAAQDARAKLDQGGVADPNDVPKKGAVDQAFDNFVTDRKKGVPSTQAIANAFGTVIKGAAMGDPQAVFDPAKYAAEAARVGHGAEYNRGG